ncbi:MAG: TlpA family protein disulfide reductase [Gammaproteobacteria bacterium]|nr:MAG: TlpA family protein disulfide reductase [Gammaproteobacteria bacterium]
MKIAKIRYLILFTMLLLSGQLYAGGLKDFAGKAASIEDFSGKGKWLIVMLWASDCHVCNSEAHQYIDFHTAHSDLDATVLGISLDGEKKKQDAEGFIDKHSVNFPNLIGEPEDVANLFTSLTGAPWIGTPTFLIYTPQGELKAQQVGAAPAHLIEEFIQENTTVASTK